MQTRTAQILVSLLFLTTAISSCDKKEVSPWNQMIEVNNQIVPPVFPLSRRKRHALYECH